MHFFAFQKFGSHHLKIWSGYGPGVPLYLLFIGLYILQYIITNIIYTIVQTIEYRSIDDNLNYTYDFLPQILYFGLLCVLCSSAVFTK